MPTTFFKSNGVDLDDLFEPIRNNAKIADVGFKTAGTDLANYFLPANRGLPFTESTGFKSGATDLGQLFARRVIGGLFTWGDNQNAVLGQGNIPGDVYTGSSSPVQVAADSSWVSISTTSSHAAAIRSDGKLFAWGYNVWGQVGDGTLESRSSPVQIGSSSWTAVSAYEGYTVAIRSDGKLFSWGVNLYGELGHNDKIWRSSPTQIGSDNWYYLGQANAVRTTMAIRSDRKLFGWGYNIRRQIGDGTSTYRSSPVQIGSSSWNAVSAGYSWTSAIRSDGKLFSWGYQNFGVLGNNVSNFAYIASPIQIGSDDWLEVDTGMAHTQAIRSDYKLFTWGTDYQGRLGLNTVNVHRSSPTQVGSSSWIAVGAHRDGGLAIRSDGKLFSWGAGGDTGNFSRLGDGGETRSSPVQVGSSSWTAVDGGYTVFARTIDNRLFAWGWNTAGVMGTGVTDYYNKGSRSSPTQVGSSSWIAVATSKTNEGQFIGALGIRSDGLMFGWGENTEGLPIEGHLTVNASPVQIGSSSWIAVAAGAYHAMAIRSDNLLFTWGSNNDGQLGDGTQSWNRSSSPAQIGASSWIAIDAFGYSSYGLTSDYKLFSWGQSYQGQLGLNDTDPRSSPTQVGSSSWIAIRARKEGGMGITADYKLFGWGYNSNGEIGDGTTEWKSSPVQVGSSSWIAIGGYYAASYGITSDYKLFSWGGYNSNGEIGDGTRESRSSPVQIGSSSWIAVAGGYTHAVAIRSDYKLFSWGGNNGGELGDGTQESRSSPVQVGSSSWVAVFGGYASTSAIKAP